jgi:hypothetical protein
MGPGNTAPRPEDSALRTIDAYARSFDLTITASRGDWTVTGPGLDSPVTIASYTELAAWLAGTYGWPVIGIEPEDRGR